MPSSYPTVEPALTPPDGQTSNFINPISLMPAVIATATLVYVVSTVSVLARLFIKAYIVRAHHIEDFLSYFAWAGLTTYTSLLLYIEHYGLARHMWDVPLVQLPHILYYVNVLYCIYGPTTAAAKLSALFQIKRIFAITSHNRVWWVVIVSIVANGIFYTGLSLSYVFECWPREKIWDSTVPGLCINGNSSNLAAGILNLISDTEALLLPAWAIWHLQMPIRRKLNAYAVFAVGSLAIAIGIGGIYVRVLVLRYSDFTWLGTKLALLVISEIAVVIAVGCSPVMPRLYRYFREPKRASGVRDNPVACKDIITIGGSGGSGPTGTDEKKFRKGGALASSLAKYLGPVGATGMTTLESRTSLVEHGVELRQYVATIETGGEETCGNRSGVLRTAEVHQESAPGQGGRAGMPHAVGGT
ncbi:hypothetical protein SLS53_006695 [Cytospora paraplurivora]|uniref:Rhodopsin domain-containing protein n=1 Tax=Cytospora paraplurivora TaxID=2898453 RepID=A0AAN9U307_9PEZI